MGLVFATCEVDRFDCYVSGHYDRDERTRMNADRDQVEFGVFSATAEN